MGAGGPRGNGHVVGAPDAGPDGAAREGHGLRAEAVDVVAAVDAGARVLHAGHHLQELGVVLAEVAAGVSDGEVDVVALGVEVGDGLLVRVKLLLYHIGIDII